MSTSKLQLLSDLPIGETGSLAKDGLNFQKYAEVLGEVAINTTGPFTIGIFGEWGTGKTSLLRLIKEYLENQDEINAITIWFNPWQFEPEKEPLFPLIATILNEINNPKKKSFLKKLGKAGKSLTDALESLSYGLSLKTKFNIGLAEFEVGVNQKEITDRYEELKKVPLFLQSNYIDAYNALSNVNIPNSSKIVVIVDDLDRCFPDNAIRLLESIKLVLAQKGFIFFLGVARQVLEGYLQHRYQNEFGIAGFRGQDYLDKIVQLPFHIPPHQTRMEVLWARIIERLDHADRDDFKKLVPIIGPATGSNPRVAVRFINNLLIDRAIFKTLYENKWEDDHISFFAISRAIQLKWPVFLKLLSISEDTCTSVAECVNTVPLKEHTITEKGLPDIAKLLISDSDLLQLLKSESGQKWLNEHGRRKETIDFLLTQRSEKFLESTASGGKFDSLIVFGSGDEEAEAFFGQIFNQERLFCVFFKNYPDAVEPSFDENRFTDLLDSSKILVFLIPKTQLSPDKIKTQIWLAQNRHKKIILILLPGVNENNLSGGLKQFARGWYKLNSYVPEMGHAITNAIKMESMETS